MPPDPDLYMLVGKLGGQIESLIKAVEDDREQARLERQETLQKAGRIEVMEAQLDAVTAKVDSLKTQTYSNKAQIDGFESKLGVVTSIYSRAMGLITFLGTVLAMAFTGLWWVVSHWDEVFSFFKNLPNKP